MERKTQSQSKMIQTLMTPANPTVSQIAAVKAILPQTPLMRKNPAKRGNLRR